MKKNIITENGYEVKQSISGYWRLMKDGDVIFDDSACVDLNEDRETAEAFFIEYLNNKKVSTIKVYPSNMEVFTNGEECIHVKRDMFSELNKDEARESLEEQGFLREDIDNILDEMEIHEWLNEGEE